MFSPKEEGVRRTQSYIVLHKPWNNVTVRIDLSILFHLWKSSIDQMIEFYCDTVFLSALNWRHHSSLLVSEQKRKQETIREELNFILKLITKSRWNNLHSLNRMWLVIIVCVLCYKFSLTNNHFIFHSLHVDFDRFLLEIGDFNWMEIIWSCYRRIWRNAFSI